MADYLDDPNWRDDWKEIKARGGEKFGEFIIRRVCRYMTQLGYIETNEREWVEIRNPVNQTPLYHLAFFSRNPLGMKFWKTTVKRTADEKTKDLFEEMM